MMNQATQDFIRQHQDEDVRQLAFLGSKNPEVDMPFALDQIRGRKMARAKLPRWANIDGIIYPPHISMEQCSSESTALYKAELAARLLGLPDSSFSEEIGFVDLTGGFGVDFSYIAARLGSSLRGGEGELRSLGIEERHREEWGWNRSASFFSSKEKRCSISC